MIRLTLALGALIAITAILVMPNAPTHLAKAVSCSSSTQSGSPNNIQHHRGVSLSANSGSCATAASAGAKFASAGIIINQNNNVGKNGGCEARSAESTNIGSGSDGGQGSSVVRTLHNF